MRIKRFVASDMRTALRMVRDDQGPEAVILSNRPVEGGIEVVAATDYDELLMQQALRVAAPSLATTPATQAEAQAPSVRTTAPKPAAMPLPLREPALAEAVATPMPAMPSRADAMIAALSRGDASQARARAATHASAGEPMPAAAVIPAQTNAPADAVANALSGTSPRVPGDDFRAMLARMTGDTGTGLARPARNDIPAPTPTTIDSDAHVDSETRPDSAEAARAEPSAAASDGSQIAATPAAAPILRAVPAEDPALGAMRAELAAMRLLMEKQAGDLAIERLRGSPSRLAAFDALKSYGCDDALAQDVAARIDPRMDPARIHAPMRDEIARLLVVHRVEPIDDGGVIALVGPTGSGKTTTAAKLAARFAERHRARDVALVTTDTERVGAREQLHAHGRKLGITVCEAEGPEALNQTLAQLADYPLVLVDTAGYAARDRAMLGQILWLRTARRVRSLLVLPANAHPHDLTEIARRYRPATPEGVILTKVDETGRLGAALSVLVNQNLSLAYTSAGQQVPADLEAADPTRLATMLDTLRRAASNPLATEDRHAVA